MNYTEQNTWPPKHKWPLNEFDDEPCSALNANYPSAEVFRSVLEADLEDQVKRGWAFRTTLEAAQGEYDLVSIAPLSVIQEAEDKFRTLYDGSNRVRVNHRIKVLDEVQLPSALDLQRVVTADPCFRIPSIALVLGVGIAHQNVPVSKHDWGLLACSTCEKPELSMLTRLGHVCVWVLRVSVWVGTLNLSVTTVAL